jgi:hypothetical protein
MSGRCDLLDVNGLTIAAYLLGRWGLMMVRVAGALAVILFSVVAGQTQEAPPPKVDVTGAWDVTITMSGGSVSGLAILSQDGTKITGMLGPALTDMFPVEGTWDGDKLTIVARPRKGRTAAFAKCELTGTRERMTGTIDTDKGTIEFIRKQRQN